MQILNFIQQELLFLSEQKTGESPELLLMCGEMNFTVMANVIEIINQKLNKLNLSSSRITKTKLLSTEIIQNVFKHSEKNNVQNCYFAMYLDHENAIILRSGNSVAAQNVSKLKTALAYYDSLDADQLKDYYIQSLRDNSITGNDNAGLGLITLFHRSYNNITYSIDPINDKEYYYKVQVKIYTN